MSETEMMTEPEWLAAEPTDRAKLTAIMSAVRRCFAECSEPRLKPTGPHMSAAIAELLIGQMMMRQKSARIVAAIGVGGSDDCPQPFALQRGEDVTGVSGTGTVAHGALFADGTVAIRWAGEFASTVIWATLADAMHVHGHDGRTKVVWLMAEFSEMAEAELEAAAAERERELEAAAAERERIRRAMFACTDCGKVHECRPDQAPRVWAADDGHAFRPAHVADRRGWQELLADLLREAPDPGPLVLPPDEPEAARIVLDKLEDQ